ncbi:hypothetical protein B0T18DRAFT_100521 [Schizothecium vesticola]|uniref:Uncharacterized protein n=1 Tax=Schizothecium vesticola TaxID=314040 RepID=A0AA40F1C3_9PEZI|nr:hypothetical protein B0T18DRAFT_100521 [Schizothecium vesticola]
MEDKGYQTSSNLYPAVTEPSSQEESPSENANPVDGFQAEPIPEINDDDLYISSELHYALSSAYPRQIDLSSSTESLSIKHELIASYEPVPAPNNPFSLDNTVGRAPSSVGDSSNDERLNTPGTDDEPMAASPVERCAENALLHSPNRRDEPESDNSCVVSLRVNTGSSGSSTDNEDEQLGLGPGGLAANLNVHETEAAAADLMRLRLGSSIMSAASAPRSSASDDSPVPDVHRGNYNTSRMGVPRSAKRPTPRSLAAESYPYPQRGTRWRDARK